jgi:hypothetical protein
VLVRDEQPWGSAMPPAAFYLYSPDRRGQHAEALLGSCRGFLRAVPMRAGGAPRSSTPSSKRRR